LGREGVAFSFANKDGLYLICECLQPIATQINDEARPKIIDPPVMLIADKGMLHVAFPFAYKCSLYVIHECLHPIDIKITQDARSEIDDAPLSFILRMNQGVYLSCFRL